MIVMNVSAIHPVHETTTSRIPAALQEVFLASNRGETVDKPPSGGLAFRLFRRSRRQPISTKSTSLASSIIPHALHSLFHSSTPSHNSDLNKKDNKSNNPNLSPLNENRRSSGHDGGGGGFARFYRKRSLSRPSTTTFGELHVQAPQPILSQPDLSTTEKTGSKGIRILTFRRVRNEKSKATNYYVSADRKENVPPGTPKDSKRKSDTFGQLSERPAVVSISERHSSNLSMGRERPDSPLDVSTPRKFECSNPRSPSSVVNFNIAVNDDSESALRIPIDTSPFSPQSYLDSILSRRGYSTTVFDTLETAYHNDPTPLQEASFTAHLVALVKSGNTKKVRNLLRCGLSPNPSNYYGESLLHLVCRLGSHEMLQVMLECGTNVQVCDDFGRTPLHDACWCANLSFETIDLLLERDCHLLYMADSHGATPLAYVRKEHWTEWIRYIDSMCDKYWPPPKNKATDNSNFRDYTRVLAKMPANTRPLNSPRNALEIEMARMVATGHIEPEEVELLMERDHTENFQDLPQSSKYRNGDSEESSDDKDNNENGPVDSLDEYSEDDEDYDDDEYTDFDEFDFDDDDDFNKFRCCKDSIASKSMGDSRDDMFMDDDDLEEMLQRIAMAKRQAKEMAAANQQ